MDVASQACLPPDGPGGRHLARRRLLGGIAAAPLLLAGCATGPGAAPGVTVERDIAYADRPETRLDVYRPAGATGRAPLVVYFHGGAWQFGSKDEIQEIMFARRLAARGAVVVSANYSLAPRACFPNFLEDGAAAAAWAHAHAAAFGADPGQIYFAGHSAGAYNAVMLAVDAEHTAAAGVPPGAVRGAVGLAGVYSDFFMDLPAFRTIFPANSGRSRAAAAAHLSAASPRLLLLAGGMDLIAPPEETRALQRAAQAVAAPARAIVFPGIGHLGMLSAGPWLPSLAPVVEEVGRFVAVA